MSERNVCDTTPNKTTVRKSILSFSRLKLWQVVVLMLRTASATVGNQAVVGCYALTVSTIFANAAGWFIAKSARTLRSRVISFLFKPLINCEYDIPCWRAAALMRVIHKLRNSRFFARRSRNAYCQPFSMWCLAIVHTLLRAPQYPLACSSIFLRRAREATLFFERGIVL